MPLGFLDESMIEFTFFHLFVFFLKYIMFVYDKYSPTLLIFGEV